MNLGDRKQEEGMMEKGTLLKTEEAFAEERWVFLESREEKAYTGEGKYDNSTRDEYRAMAMDTGGVTCSILRS